MRSAVLVSAFAVLTWLAHDTASVGAQTDDKAASCQSCGAGHSCHHCAEGKACPHCEEGKSCPHCKGEKAACTQCGHHRHHKWGSFKWEYKCVRPGKKPEAISKQFSGLGAEGWKLVEADGGIWCFARMLKSN